MFHGVFRSTGGGFCNRRHASYFGGDISSFGSENVKSVGWLSEPPEGQPKLRKLQAIRAVVLLHGCRGSHQSGRLVQALGDKVGSKLVINSRYSRHSGEAPKSLGATDPPQLCPSSRVWMKHSGRESSRF